MPYLDFSRKISWTRSPDLESGSRLSQNILSHFSVLFAIRHQKISRSFLKSLTGASVLRNASILEPFALGRRRFKARISSKKK